MEGPGGKDDSKPSEAEIVARWYLAVAAEIEAREKRRREDEPYTVWFQYCDKCERSFTRIYESCSYCGNPVREIKY